MVPDIVMIFADIRFDIADKKIAFPQTSMSGMFPVKL